MNKHSEFRVTEYPNGGVKVAFEWYAHMDEDGEIEPAGELHAAYGSMAEASKDIADFLNGKGEWS